MRRLFLAAALVALTSAPALADSVDIPLFPPRARAWDSVAFGPVAAPRTATPAFSPARITLGLEALRDEQTAPPRKLAAVEYSDGYKTRAKIHKYASFAMLPLVGTELFLGNSLYNNPGESKKSAHIAVGASIMGLFAANTVTGVWNMLEARKDPSGRTRRKLHAILMMAADVGFLATAATGPGESEFENGAFRRGGGSRTTHRAIAFTSMATATAGYLAMLFGGH